MKIIDNNLNYDEINSFIKISQYSNYMQCPNWAKYRLDKNYFELAIYNSSNHIFAYGVAYALKKYGKNFLYFPRGPILDYADIESLNQFRNLIMNYAKQNNFDGVLIDPAISQLNISYKIRNNNDYFLQQYSSQEAIVNLENINEYDLLYTLKGKTRYYINKAIQHNLKCVISNKSFDLDIFLNLYNENANKRNFAPKTKDELLKFINSNDVTFIQTLKDNTPINMSICIIHCNTMYYVLGANNKKIDDFHGSYFLHFYSMLYAIQKGLKYYNFGGVYCKDEDKDSPDFGLLRFKKMFVNEFTKFIGEVELE